MRDPRFATIKTARGFNDNFGKNFASEEEAHASFVRQASEASDIAGRALTRAELVSGVSRPPTDPATKLRDDARHATELAGPPLPRKSTAEIQLAHAQQRLIDSLPPAERAVKLAEQAVEREQAEKAQAAAYEKMMSNPDLINVLSEIDRTLMVAKYDSTISQQTIDELQHQRRMLTTYGAWSTAEHNLNELKKAMIVEAQEQVKQFDRRSDRERKRLANIRTPKDFSVPPEFKDGKVILRCGGKVVETIPEAYYAASKAQLLEMHFGVGRD